MKKSFLALALIISISFIANNIYSQETNYARVNLLGLATTQFVGLGFEHNLNGYSTLCISADFGRYAKDSKKEFGQTLWKKQIIGFGITPAHSRNPSGWFTGLYARYMDVKYTKESLTPLDDFSEKANNLGGGAILGYKYKKPDSPFFFETLVGLGWGISTLTGYESDILPKETNTWRYEFSIGYAF
jgi:hypothetical protein